MNSNISKTVSKNKIKTTKIRDRYTILREGITAEKASEVAKITGVIE